MARPAVLHVTPYYEGAWGYGGIPRAVAVLAAVQASRGMDVTVVTTDAGEARRRAASPAASAVTVHQFPNVSNALAYHLQLFLPRGLGRWLDAHAREFDVAHVHGCHHLPGALAARACTAAGVPWVLQPHGTAPYLERRRVAKRLFDATLGHGATTGAAGVLAVSEAEARTLTALGLGPVRVVGNAVDPREFEPPPSGARLRQRLHVGDAPVVLFLGKLTPRKRVEVLVDAFAAMPDPTAVLVIAGNDLGAGGTIRRAIARHRLEHRVRLTGLLRGRERLEALALADVVVYPSRDEVFGLVPLEALLAGTPVIVAGDSGCGEVVSAIGGGIVLEPLEAPSLAAAIESVLASCARWRRRAEAAATRVRESFGPDAVAARVAAAYDELAATARARHTASRMGVSFVIPVRDGERWLEATLASIHAQADGRPFEVLAVEDGSRDGSPAILARQATAGRVRVLAGEGHGAAAALNLGLRHARHSIVCQVDQDVVLEPGWLPALTAAFDDPSVAAAQGWYVTPREGGFWARAAGLDLESRYAAIRGDGIDHVCTGNTAYRVDALRRVGGFDETLGYGYDNDLSYRLTAAGQRLVFRRDARAVHHWRDSARGYLRQQYGVGYGRLDVITRHPRRVAGDDVSGPTMIAHAAVMLAALAGGGLASMCWALGVPWQPPALTAATLVGALALERAVAGARTAWRFGDAAPLAWPIVHLLRDAAWAAAIGVWALRRARGRASRPTDSMSPAR